MSARKKQPERLVGCGEVADQLGLHETTIRLWVRRGLVTPDQRTLGGHARFSRRGIEQIRRAMQAGAAA